jgi:hypothetical protein
MTEVPFKNLKVGGFRGLVGLELESCGPVNLLVGENNSGKTSILEALLLLSGPMDVGQWMAAVELRGAWPLVDARFAFGGGLGRLEGVAWLFPRVSGEMQPLVLEADGERPIHGITARAEWVIGDPPGRPMATQLELVEGVNKRFQGDTSEPGLSLELELFSREPRLEPATPTRNFRMLLWRGGRSTVRRPHGSIDEAWPVVFASSISHRSDGYLTAQVGMLLRKKERKDNALALLRELDPDIVDMLVVTPEKPEGENLALPRRMFAPSLHIEHAKSGLVPVQVMGDGTRRAIHLAALLTDVGPGGVLLVDELEVGMHTSVLRNVFGWLWRACEASGVQLFATTHSLEAVDCILESVPDRELALYRLEKGSARRFDGKTLRMARVDLGQEVR